MGINPQIITLNHIKEEIKSEEQMLPGYLAVHNMDMETYELSSNNQTLSWQ